MSERSDYGRILTERGRLGPFPVERLKRVERPTTRITGDVQRIDVREHGFNRAGRGDFGPVVRREVNRFVMNHPLSAAEADMNHYLAPMAYGEVASLKAPIPEDPEVMARHIKRLGYFLRADIVGICRLPQYAVYSHGSNGNPIELNHQFAIVVVVDQGYETMNGSTGSDWISNSQSFRSYSTSAFISCIIANYIRRLGYPARAHHARNYQVLIPPLLLLSGIGEMCRMGDSVLNPFIGPRFKAAAVTTDLPLLPDKPIDFGLQEFCHYCKKCARECPSRAIPTGDKVMHNGYEVWKLDVERCTKFRVTNQNGAGCGTCIKVCPWNKAKTWYHDVTVWMLERSSLARRAIIRLDDILGYGKQNERDKWWLDLEDTDGALRIPGRSV
ncbi:reductive dehalogenase [Dehalococcoidia bacterium]|nr:reductive dehalogenase [Dehalococcoidia bacterium]